MKQHEKIREVATQNRTMRALEKSCIARNATLFFDPQAADKKCCAGDLPRLKTDTKGRGRENEISQIESIGA